MDKSLVSCFFLTHGVDRFILSPLCSEKYNFEISICHGKLDAERGSQSACRVVSSVASQPCKVILTAPAVSPWLTSPTAISATI